MIRLALYRGATAVVSYLPLALCYRLARMIGLILALLPNRRRDAVRANLAMVYGAVTTDRRVRVATRRALQHAMLNYVDLFRLGRPDAERFIRHIYTPSIYALDEALAQGKGAILVSAHLGNFDTVVQKLALRGDRVLIPVEPIDPPALREYVTRQRASFGTRIEPIGPDTFKLMTAHLRGGGVVVIVCDRDIQGSGYQVPFFGNDVSLPNAAMLLSIRTGAPVVGAFGYRHRNNRISAHLTPLPLPAGDPGRHRSVRADLDRGMKAIAAMLEIEIRQDPGQWVVQQPIFAGQTRESRPSVLPRVIARWSAMIRPEERV